MRRGCCTTPDQDCTSVSHDCQRVLEALGIVCSMSRRGTVYDNAVMNHVFATVKSELAEHFGSFEEARMDLSTESLTAEQQSQ